MNKFLVALIFIFLSLIIVLTMSYVKSNNNENNCILKNFNLSNNKYDYFAIVECCVDELGYERTYCLGKYRLGFDEGLE